MPKVKLDIDDAEAMLNLADVLTGKRSAGCQFVDRRDRTRLAPFYAVAVQNCTDALRISGNGRRRKQREKSPSPRTRGFGSVGSSERGTLTPPTFEAAYVGARNSPRSQPRVWSDFIGSTTSVLCTYSHAGHLKVRNSKPDTAKLMRVSIIRSAWHFGQAAPGR